MIIKLYYKMQFLLMEITPYETYLLYSMAC